MRQAKESTRPVLMGLIKDILIMMSRSRTLATSLTKRAQIILLASEGKTNQYIAKHLTMHYNSIGTWRKRFIEAMPLLQALENSEPDKLQDEIKRIFSDKPRSGAPKIYTQEQIVRIIELACKSPCEFGYEVSHWSLNLLVNEIIKQGISERMSAKSVSRFLKRMPN